MARLAELKAERLKRGQPADDLDQMFESLERGDTVREKEYLQQINQELEQMFMETQQVHWYSLIKLVTVDPS